MIFKKLIFISFLFVVQLATAQDKPSIRASVDRSRILIGEPMQLTIEASFGSTMQFPRIDSIPHFEILKDPQFDSSVKDGIHKIKVVYQLTSFDSGHWVIPSYALAKNVKTDTIPVDIVFSEFDPAKDYHDIKDILEVKAAKKKFPWWWYAAAGVLLIVLLVIFLRKKKPVVAVPVTKPLINAYDEAMKELELLQQNKPAAKQYYSKLTDIFRLYIYRKKGLLSLQKTTDDLVVQLKGLNLDKDQFDQLSQSLRLADFVKFAKYVPGEEDDRNAFRDIIQAIKTIEQTDNK